MMTQGNCGLFGNTAQNGSLVSLDAPESERGKSSPVLLSGGQDSQLLIQWQKKHEYLVKMGQRVRLVIKFISPFITFF